MRGDFYDDSVPQYMAAIFKSNMAAIIVAKSVYILGSSCRM